MGIAFAFDFRRFQLTNIHSQLFFFVILYGFASGATLVFIQAKPSKMFGTMPEYSKLYSFLSVFQILGAFTGSMLTGKLRVVSGSYALPFLIFIILCILLFFLCIALEFCLPKASNQQSS